MKQKLNIISITLLTAFASFSASANDKINIKAGFAVDKGFGVSALINNQFNIMLGNDGIAADYLFKQGRFSTDLPFTWYIAGGAYAEWDDGLGVRLPLGLNLNFSQKWNAYAQIAPDLDVDDNVKFGAQFAMGVRYSF